MKRPRAFVLLRPTPHYRREAFEGGLRRHGFEVLAARPALGVYAGKNTVAANTQVEPADVLLLWNRHAFDDDLAKRFLAAGGRVIVAENGWIGHDGAGHHLFAICRDHHNGAGWWYVGDDVRWTRQNMPPLLPWREGGEELVALPQRSIGARGVAMPRGWEQDVVARLKKRTARPVRVRPHPGPPKTDPLPDLQRAWAAVTWGSGAGIKAIVGGVPVFHELERWIGAPAARFGIDQLEAPFTGDRFGMLHRLAWAQFSAAEIASGLPFDLLLNNEPRNDTARKAAATA